ncbi:RGS domain [Trinorchestia longiramus]|nr:RGS domain [Trinorchestia longiramus]
MCFSSLDCDCKASAILQLQQSSKKSEARGVSGRDVVLGAAQRSGPHGGKMSSSRSPKSAPHASTPATAAASCTPEPLSCSLLAALATPASSNTPASCSLADPVTAAQASSSFNTSSKELESSVDVIAKTSISFSVNPSSAVIISTGLEPSASTSGTTSSPSKSVGGGSVAERSNIPLSPSTRTFPHHLQTEVPACELKDEKPPGAGVEEGQSLNCSSGSILVPSVCWEQAGGEVRAALYDLSRSGRSAEADDRTFGAFGRVTCEETRPPVLGEEQRIGQEEDLVTEQDILMQGDGWGECPAVEGSGEGESPEVGSACVAAGGGGSLEGSSSNGSNSSSNPLEWSHSIDHLLLDPVGVSAFMAFLREEKGCSNALEFFFACKGLGSQPSEHLRQLLLVIWKKFIRNYNVRVSPETHADLSEKIYRGALSADMFQVAQNEVLEYLKQTSYPAFLQSQHYIEQLQQYHAEQQKLDLDDSERGTYQSSLLQQNPVQSISYSPHRYSKSVDDPRVGNSGVYRGDYASNAGHGSKWNPSPAVLTTVYEHEAATPHTVALLPGHMKHLSGSCSVPRPAAEDDLTCVSSSGPKRPHLSSKILAATVGQRALVNPKQGIRSGLNPYHASYGRGHHASRNDSERQSVSSGAYTDDTRSYTDGSIDGDTGYGGSSSKLMRREKMIIKENLRLNEELQKQKFQQQQQSMLASALGGGAFVVPRTQLSVCPSTNLAKYPEQFAKVLTEKLEAVLRRREGHEKVQRAFKKIQESGGAADVYRREHAVNSLPPSVLMNRIIEKIPLDEDDSGQAILDQHVSRVWQDNSRGSPVCFPSSPPHMMGVCRPPAASLHHHHHHHHSYAPNATSTNAGPNAKQKGSNKTPYRSPTFVGMVQQKNAMEKQQQQQYPLGVSSPYSDYPQTVAPAMPYSKSWHQLRSRDQTSVDVYGAFSSDSGTVPDFCESSGRSGRRHHSGVPKTRSVPEHMMDSCAGSGSERYPSSSGSGSRGRTGGGGSELTDSGVSVISDSRHSLLTATQSSTVHQRVETWLQDTGDSSGRKVMPGGGLVKEGDVSLPPSHGPVEDRALLSSSARRGTNSATSIWSPQQQGGSADHARRRHRGMAGNSSGAPADLMRRATTSPAAAAARYGGGSSGVASDSGLTSSGGGLTSSDGGPTSSGGGLTSSGATSGSASKAAASAPGSDRNTSSSSGSTMRKAFKPSTKSTSGGGGGSDGQSSCSRGSDGSSLTESTTVVYSFCDDNVPFVIKIVARSITLKRFKQHLPKRGNYRFFFKKHCEEFGVIQEEMTEDEEVLPLYEGRIFAQIRKAD